MCHRDKTLTTIRELCNDQVLATNSDLWNGRARNELMKYEEHLYDYFKRGLSDHEQKVWTFWNAVFYCGTIYTTIGESRYWEKIGIFYPCEKYKMERLIFDFLLSMFLNIDIFFFLFLIFKCLKKFLDKIQTFRSIFYWTFKLLFISIMYILFNRIAFYIEIYIFNSLRFAHLNYYQLKKLKYF